MNEKNHTNRGGYESQTPDNTDAQTHHEGALWNSPIGRRVFLKRTGAATVATAVALHGFRVQVQAQQTPVILDYRLIQVHRGTYTWISYASTSEAAAITLAKSGSSPNNVLRVADTSLNLLATRSTIVQGGTTPSDENPNPKIELTPFGDIAVLDSGPHTTVNGEVTMYFCKVQATAYRKTTTYYSKGGTNEIDHPNSPNDEAEIANSFTNGHDYNSNE